MPHSDKRPEAGSMVERAARAYLRILLGGRNQEVLGDALGVKRAMASHILNGRRPVQMDQLQHMCEAWGIDASAMFGHMARVALNLELGAAPDEGIRLPAGFGAVSEGDARR